MSGSITYKQYNEQLRLPEQERDEKLLLKYKHFVLAYEPGKGKSYPVIHAILEVQKLKGRPIKVLVMSDATCIKQMWHTEMVPQGILPKETYFVTDRTAIGKVKIALETKDWDIIVCDECQSLRSGVTRAKSKYAKLVWALTKKTEYVFGMTGTLAGNNTIEPWCVLHNLNVAGMGAINPHKFKNAYCIQELGYGPFGNFLKPTKLNERGEQLLAEAYKTGVSFWPYDENDQMPPCDIRYETFKVPATKSYTNALQGILQCGEAESTVMKAIALQKAQQALNGFLYYDFEAVRHTYAVPEFINPKLEYVVNQCKQKIHIIAYRFQEDGHYIRKALDEANIKHCNTIKDFKQRATNEHVVLVLQCSKGKSANIQVCQDIIYYTADFSFINYKQMIHRCYRRGQVKPCSIVFLVNEPEDNDTVKVEFKIWQALRNKQTIHDTLMSIKRSIM